jgi:hypothetical protein
VVQDEARTPKPSILQKKLPNTERETFIKVSAKTYLPRANIKTEEALISYRSPQQRRLQINITNCRTDVGVSSSETGLSSGHMDL